MEMDNVKVEGPRKALGRGLAALIPAAVAGAGHSGLRSLPIEKVHPNTTQPRKTFDAETLSELSASIAAQGVLQPIVVRRRGSEYEIVAGERRWRAAAQAGLHEVPAIVKELSDTEALQVALIENIQRQDLDPLEEAEAYGRLMREHGFTHETLAAAVGKSRVAITNSLRLLKLPESVLGMLARGELTAGHARALMMVPDAATMQKLAKDVSTRKLSVREAERLARSVASAREVGEDKRGTPSEQRVEEQLQRELGTKVRLKHRQGRGRIEIYFHSADELEGLLAKLLP